MARYDKAQTLAYLDEHKIPYEKMEHAPVYTMEEMDAAGISAKGGVVKNLFLRDAKGASKLSFASAERLEKYLGVVQGAVSPLGVLNDENHAVEVVFDRDLTHAAKLGIHPNDNTATLWLSFRDLKKLIEDLGNAISFIKV